MRQKYVRLLLFTLAIGILPRLLAQNCGQRDTIIFFSNSTELIDIEISDYFNDDLSDPMQGLCAIELGFVHQFVENFELSLTSPAGQTVSLLGPNSDDPFAFTPGTEWQISLVNCASPAEPDSAFTAQWNNEQVENWVPFSLYTGSYYPFGGCLEDFNTGPVNGTWTFNITNDPSNNPGAITYIRLVFCDSRGVECCFAQAGEWQNEAILSCVNSDTLLIDPNLLFPFGEADTSEYDYGFLIARDGIYLELDSIADLRDAPPGEYDICGFSYRAAQLDSLPPPDGILTLDSIRSNLEGLEPWFCGMLTPECLHVSIIAPPDTTRLEERICRGDSIVVGGQSFMDSGFYTVDLESYAHCDSIVTLDLFVQEVLFTSIDSTVCPGDTVFIGPTPYFETGVFQDTLPTVELGCDSIVTLNLVVLSPQFTPLSPVICAGESYMVGDSILQNTGFYQILLTSEAGCDSLVTVDLLVLDPLAVIDGPEEINCAAPVAELNANNSAPFAALSFQWLNLSETVLGNGPTLLANTAGDYILEVSQESGGTICTARDTFNLRSNFSVPVADPGTASIISCANPVIEIGGPNTSTGPAYLYSWETSNGNFVSPTDQPTVQVDAAGDYQLIVTDTFSFCVDTAFLTVTADQDPPTVELGDSFVLNCLVQADTLDGTNSLGNGISAFWSGPCIQEVPAPATAIINCPAWYYLEVVNSNNGCTAVDSLQILQDIRPADAIIGLPDILDCLQPTVPLDGSTSLPVGLLDFEWLGPSSQTSSASIFNVNEAGPYELIVIRQDNFCRDTSTISVAESMNNPVADTGPDSTLSCSITEILLSGANTSMGPTFIYQWYNNGELLLGEINSSLLVNEAGEFVLEVVDITNGCSALDTVTISEDFIPPEDVDGGLNLTLDCGGSVVTLMPDSTNFSRPVSWEWTADCIDPVADIWALETDCPGEYTLTVTNIDNGCQGSDTVRVSLSPNYSRAILPDTVYLSCIDGNGILDNTGSVGSLFRWFRDDVLINLPNNQPTVNQPGIYTLITSDINFICTDTAMVQVLANCLPVAAVSPPDTINCFNESVTLSAEIFPAQGPLSYSWIAPAMNCTIGNTSSSQIEVVCPGLYQLIVTHDIFDLADTTEVMVFLDMTAPVINAGENVVISCSEPTANLSGTVAGNPNDFTYAWTLFLEQDTLSETINYSTQSVGTYQFSAQNITNGCVSNDIVQVSLNNTPPQIAFGSSIFPCEADSFRLQAFVNPVAGNYLYNWSGPGIIGDQDSLGVLINDTGTYFFEVINQDNGCSNNDSITVTEQTCVPCLEFGILDTLDCVVFEVPITATFCRPCDGCTLQWSDQSGVLTGETNLELLVAAPGTYTLTATDTLGFTTSLSANIIRLDTPPEIDLGPNRFLNCDSNNVTLQNLLANPSLDLLFAWEETGTGPLPEQGPVLTVDTPGEYVLILTDMLTGCTASDTIVVTNNTTPPIASAGPDQLLTCQDNAVVLDGTGSTLSGVTYEWTGPNAACLSGGNTNSPLATCEGQYILLVTSTQTGCFARDTVWVGLDENLPTLTPFPDTVLNCFNSEIVLSASPPPTGSFDISWCPLDELGNEISADCAIGQTDTLINSPGLYRFTATNSMTGCSNNFTVTVSADTIPPQIDAGAQDTLLCNLASLQLEGTSAVDGVYSWTNQDGHQIDNPGTLQPTIYDVGWYVLEVQSNLNGCIGIDSVFIEEDANTPLLQTGNDTLLNCFNPEVRLSAVGTTFNGNALWAWETPEGLIVQDATTASPLVAAPGWYFVHLEDEGNGCYVTDSILVTIDTLSPTAIVADLSTLTLSCAQDTLALDGAMSFSSSSAPLSFNWTAVPPGTLFPDLSAPQVLTDRPGNYSLIVTDTQNGCQDTLDFNIDGNFTPPPLELADASPISCAESNSILTPIIPTTGIGFQFEWRDVTGLLISTEYSATVNEPGLYYLRLTDETNGCSSFASILVSESMVFPEVEIVPPAAINCGQPTVVLDGSASSVGMAYIYEWSGSSGSLLGTGLLPTDSTASIGTYTLMVTDTINGCSSSDSVTVSATGVPITGLELNIEHPPCEGDPFGSISIDQVIGGTPTYRYSINDQPFQLFSFFEDLPPGSYTFRVMDQLGCEWTEVVELLTPESLVLDLGEDLEVQLGDSIQLLPLTNRPITEWKWNAPELLASNAAYTPFVSPLESQFVLLTVTDQNGCTASDTIRILVDKFRDLFIPTAFSPDGNGENDRFTIYAGQEVVEIRSLRIFSRWGNMVFERENFPPNDPNLGWDGSLWNEQLNAAVFVYYAEILFQDGKTAMITGDLILMR